MQISIDAELLAEIDRRKETKRDGRSAVIRRALELYLALQRRREVDAAYARAYGGEGGVAAHDDIAELLRGQPWPDE